ncbi:hypothetical protein AW168_15555 [Nocardia brasiliensis]|uniref:Uncharacterized protein n=1 Tax=Nocardia brasiliensis (strain ATCC 700358 / HUJEG-1) TaxID=1133849 RepID=K0F2V5_NOCB7|nr:hypothetical protein O3I_027655 [Nocardia brasiliensis ATCC 700358]OCF89752.1 hypothetical protein AW168_15555 [Nocardia brasiliensis]
MAVLEGKWHRTEGDGIAYQEAIIDTRDRVVRLEHSMSTLKVMAGHTQIRLGAVEEDVAGLKQDVAFLKGDVSGLKQDVSGLKRDVSGLKQSMSGLTRSVDAIVSHFGIALPAEEAQP